MKRKDPKGNVLLPRMYYKSGRYYYVRLNRWHKLSRNYYDALRQYANLETPRSQWSDLVSLTYQGFERRWKAGELADSTYKQYTGVKARIVYGFGLFAPNEITTSTITQFLDLYESTPNMANRMLTVLKAIFDKGCRSGACDFNPASGIKRFAEGKRDRYLTDTEYMAIRANANPQTQLIMDMCYLTAQRISDVLNIRHADIGKEGISIRQGKTGKPLLLETTEELDDIVRKARALHKVTGAYLFHPRGKTTKYSYRAIRDAFMRAADKAEVKDVGLHDLRAKALTDAKREGIDAQKLAGHANPAMTERYIRLRETDRVTGPSLRKLLDT